MGSSTLRVLAVVLVVVIVALVGWLLASPLLVPGN
jgi:hypothetical protein